MRYGILVGLILACCPLGCSSGGDPPFDAGEEPVPDAGDDAADDEGDMGGDPAGDEGGGENGCLDAYPGQVLLTEVMVHPGAATGPAGRFIELHNNGFEPLRMEGWLIEDGGGNTAGLTLADDLEPGGYVLIAFEADPALNGSLEPDLLVDALDLATRRLRIIAGDVEVDAVDFTGTDWPVVAGASMNLDPGSYDLYANNRAENWCVATETYGDGDLGTPGGANTVCVPPECGNGDVEHPEDCDDGQNGVSDDGCRDDCTFTCADPARDCPDHPGDCLCPVCVPNELGRVCEQQVSDDDPPEPEGQCLVGVCDQQGPAQAPRQDGAPCDNQVGEPGDYCVAGTCSEPVCGDDIRGPLEQCDDGNQQDGDGCSAQCEFELCGNGEIDGDEQCDDGRNGNDLDGCRDDCLYSCFNPDVDCATTPGDCTGAACEPNELGQVCVKVVDVDDAPDDGNPCTDDQCDQQGNPLHPALEDGTPCDNGAGAGGDYCVEGSCIDPVCGDRIQGPDEECDDGNFDPCDGCLPTCVRHDNTCGDGITCAPETCDDTNQQAGDGCLSGCAREAGVCPPEMVTIPADPDLGVPEDFCMDRWEASRADATSTSMGYDITKAVSQPGVIPWFSNPMNDQVFLQYKLACQAAGKRLCEPEEFYAACTGPDRNTYVFGDVFDPETCNCVDTFCDDYCTEHGIEPCSTGPNCGYTYYCFHATPTEVFPDCTNVYGTFDITGNAWEIVPSTTDTRGYEVRGGAFNCGGASTRLQCTFNAGWHALYAGFRCCRDK